MRIDQLKEIRYTRYISVTYVTYVTYVRIDQLKEQRRSLIAMGTASDTTFTINRLFWAKHDGYKTVLLHITCPLEQARKQNRLRARKGQRAVPREDEYLLTRTMTESEVTVSIVRHTDLVDHYVHVDNSR